MGSLACPLGGPASKRTNRSYGGRIKHEVNIRQEELVPPVQTGQTYRVALDGGKVSKRS